MSEMKSTPRRHICMYHCFVTGQLRGEWGYPFESPLSFPLRSKHPSLHLSTASHTLVTICRQAFSRRKQPMSFQLFVISPRQKQPDLALPLALCMRAQGKHNGIIRRQSFCSLVEKGRHNFHFHSISPNTPGFANVMNVALRSILSAHMIHKDQGCRSQAEG